MASLREPLIDAAARAADHRELVADRSVFPGEFDLDEVRRALGTSSDEPTSAEAAIEQLADVVEPALVATAGPRYFGFVIGGCS
jgi:hypothetical protein